MTKKKTLSYLIEAEMEKATVFMAAKEITNKLQKVVETLAKIPADDLLPLGDAMRELFDSEQAAGFEQNVSAKINELVDAVRNARNEIADQIDALQNGEPMNDLSQTDGEDMFPDAEAAPEAGAEGGDPFAGAADEAGLGDDDMAGLDNEDPFAGIDTANPAGRPQKESARATKKVLEGTSADHRLAKQFAKLIREGKSAKQAGKLIAEQYAMPFNTVVEIITKVRNG